MKYLYPALIATSTVIVPVFGGPAPITASVRITAKASATQVSSATTPSITSPPRQPAGTKFCGFKEPEGFVTQGNKWDHFDLTYRFDGHSSKLPIDDQENVLRMAFSEWSAHTPFTFKKVAPTDSADIQINWFAPFFDHGDGSTLSFDGPLGTLAHAFYPPPNGNFAGDIHFDSSENWSDNALLYRVSIHEIGHVLGLKHSDVPDALMNPTIDTPFQKNHLQPDDLAAIHSIYGFKNPKWQQIDNNALTVDIVADSLNLDNTDGLYQLHKNDGTIWHFTAPSTWTLIDNNPATVQIAAANGQVFQRHSNGKVWRYLGTPKQWELLDDNTATNNIIARGNYLYQSRSNGGEVLWWRGGKNWDSFGKDASLKMIVCTDIGHLWKLDIAGGIYHHDGSGWTLVDRNSATVEIAAGDGSMLYARHDYGALFMQRADGAFDVLENASANVNARLFAIGHRLYVLRADGSLRSYEEKIGFFETIEDAGTDSGNPIKQIAADSFGNVWQLRANGKLQQYAS